MSILVRRSVRLDGHPTSVSLEREFWDALEEIARARDLKVAELISEIDHSRLSQRESGSLAGALRLYALKYFRK